MLKLLRIFVHRLPDCLMQDVADWPVAGFNGPNGVVIYAHDENDDTIKRDAVWIPKSQAELADGVLTLPEWLAMEKDLI